jgi:hypothetical protein
LVKFSWETLKLILPFSFYWYPINMFFCVVKKKGCGCLRTRYRKMLNPKRKEVKTVWIKFNKYVKIPVLKLAPLFEDLWRSFVAPCISNLDVRFSASGPGRFTPGKIFPGTHLNWRLV